MKIKPSLFFVFSAFLIIGASCTSNETGVPMGLENGRLINCPSSPNCVSTYADNADKKMSPLSFSGTLEQSKKKILDILKAQKRALIIADQANYIHAEFKSAIFKFIDDVEFLFDESAGIIHFRSASRTGYSDLGVNRKRMTAITEQYQKQ